MSKHNIKIICTFREFGSSGALRDKILQINKLARESSRKVRWKSSIITGEMHGGRPADIEFFST